MEDKTVTRLFEDMRDDVASFVRSNIELAKLETFEKLSKASATTSVTMVLIRVLTLFLALLFITLGFYLGHVLDALWLGFAISTGVAGLILLILYLIRKPVQRSLTNSIIRFLMRNDDDQLSYKK